MANDRGLGRNQDYSAPITQGKNYLLLIGIDQYEHWQHLSNAVKDAKEFAQVLTAQYQFEQNDVYTLFDDDATESKIYQAIRDMKRRLLPEDNLILYYSGHGHFDREFDEGFWIPVDALPDKEASFISNANIVKRINALDTQHTFLIVDSCFSGSLVVQKRNAFADEKFKSRRILASGRNETVSDGEEGKNSPFAAGLLTLLRKNTQARLDASSLIRYVKDYVYGKAKQNPVEGRIPNSDDEGGDFIFHLRKDEEKIWKDVCSANTVVEYRNYLAGFPEGKYIDAANQKINLLNEDEVWQTTKVNDNESAYEQYIKRFTPTGKYLKEAREQLDKLKKNRQQRQEIRQEMAEKENRRESMQLQFEQLLRMAEELFSNRQLEQAKKKYQEALETHLPGFAPSQQYIEDQINFCQTNMRFLRHYDHGKTAMESDNYRLAIEYFQEALKIKNNAKVEDLIRHCQLKIKSKRNQQQRSSPTAVKRTITGGNTHTAPKKRKRSIIFWILSGVGGVFALLFLIGILAGEDDALGDNQRRMGTPLLDVTHETVTFTTEQLILGSWTVDQVLVNGIDLVETYPAMSYLIGTVYEFRADNIVNEYSLEGNLSHNYSVEGNALYIASPGYDTGTIDYVDAKQLSITLPFSPDAYNQLNFTFNMSR